MRLSKIAKDLNIGIQTLIDFLEKTTGEAESWGPMSNVSDDLYALICKEFNKENNLVAIKAEEIERQLVRARIKRELSLLNGNETNVNISNNAIGFKNFRRFENFPLMELGNVTMLVGGNNSGKSTVVKAIRLVQNFLEKRVSDFASISIFSRPTFDFDVPLTSIGLYGNALHKGAESSDIEFSLQKKQFLYSIYLSPEAVNGAESTRGNIDRIEINDKKNNIIYAVDYVNSRMTIAYANESGNESEDALIQLNQELANKKAALQFSTDFGEITTLNDEIRQILKSIEKLSKEKESDNSVFLDLPLTRFVNSANDYLVASLIRNFVEYTDQPIPKSLGKNTIGYKKLVEEKKVLSSLKEKMTDSLNQISFSVSEPLPYFYAHIARQDVFYKVSDKNDYMAQAIHEYVKSRIQPGDEEYEFVSDWMRQFEIADGFRIKNHQSEAYEVRLLSQKDLDEVFCEEVNVDNLFDMPAEDSEEKDPVEEEVSLDSLFDMPEEQELAEKERHLWDLGMSLGSKGMGSIQMTILLLQLATYIKKYKNANFYHPTIMIEEPEQNLHPKVQSKLAELFFYLNKKYKFRFLIETHSEYMIRKSQVLWAGMEKNRCFDNPFSVYYFPKEKAPYQMIYKDSGDFENEFEEGFFDEATNLIYQIL